MRNHFPESYTSFAILVGLVIRLIFLVGTGLQSSFDITFQSEMFHLVYFLYFGLIMAVAYWAYKMLNKMYSIRRFSKEFWIFSSIVIGVFVLPFCLRWLIGLFQ